MLFRSSERILISADALWENGFGVVFPEIEGDEAFHEVANTLDLIEGLQPRLILPGHGAAFSDLDGALSRARSKLTKFVNSPEQHAAYAAKVLLKFKLLELQRVNFSEFVRWAAASSYLQIIHRQYGTPQTLEDWLIALIQQLDKSGAARIDGEELLNL